MGLDMYLSKKTYVGAEYEHRKVSGSIELSIYDKPVKIEFSKISEIIERVGYWRKANAIHKWFVDNVQEGKDECDEHDVSYKKLLELKTLCEKILETKDATLMPPESGFFFGSTEIDQYYFDDLTDTIKIISELDPDGDYSYQSSW